MSEDTTHLERWLFDTRRRRMERAAAHDPRQVRGDGRPRPFVQATCRRLDMPGPVRIDVRLTCETSANEGRFETV